MQDVPAGRWSLPIAQLEAWCRVCLSLEAEQGCPGSRSAEGLLTSKPHSVLGPDMPKALKPWAEAGEEAPSIRRAQEQWEQWQGM